MTDRNAGWYEIVPRLVALANRLEGEGQYNIAKLARAVAEALVRQAAFKSPPPTAREELVTEIEQVTAALDDLDLEEAVLVAFRHGIAAMAGGRLPLIHEIPHPYVCRTCGTIVLEEPVDLCPICGAWPSSFKQFLPVYWLNALEPVDALESLRQIPLEVGVLLEGLPEKLLTRPAPEGGWAIRQTISHLRDAQEVLSFRLDLLLKQDYPTLESQAVFAWAAQEEEDPPSTQQIFETYYAARLETITRLEQIPLGDWWRTGWHEEFGAVTLRQQVSYFAAHEVTHLPQIDKLRRQLLSAD
jgi:hypothetical protein